jgi:hypothetical protein
MGLNRKLKMGMVSDQKPSIIFEKEASLWQDQ